MSLKSIKNVRGENREFSFGVGLTVKGKAKKKRTFVCMVWVDKKANVTIGFGHV